MSVSNPAAPEIVLTQPLVMRFTAPNPGPKTLEGTNSYVVGKVSSYIIDPGPAIDSYQEMLAQSIREAGIRVEGIVITHRHPDHSSGARYLQSLLSAPIFGPMERGQGKSTTRDVDNALREGRRLNVDDDSLRVIETPGHTPEHVGLWLEGARVLFTGDTILGRGTTLIAPPEGNMRQYLMTLARIQSLEPVLIAPGHGPIITEPTTTIRAYIEHRRQREQEILSVLGTGPSTVAEIVERIYVDIHPDLRALADSSVDAQLEKLLDEGKVAESDGLYRLTEGAS